MAGTRKRKNPRILVVGAGPAGLATAYYLKKAGFRDVSVFERLGRVGGLCHSVTMDGLSFDLGANYVTPAYTRTLAIAAEVGAETFVAKGIHPARIRADGSVDWKPPPPQDPSGLIQAMARYLELRKDLDLDGPILKDLPEALLVSFKNWLGANDLSILEPIFWVPITTMGYGFLDKIPAPYALKFMSPATFLPIYLRMLPQMQSDDPVLDAILPWPRKFVDGFQRFWERVAWGLDVRLNIGIESIRRGEKTGVEVVFSQPTRDHHELKRAKDERTFDALILACPLDVVGSFLTLSEDECDLFGRLRFNSYVVSSYTLKAPIREIKGQAVAFMGETDFADPWAIGQVWKGQSHFIQIFSRVDPDWDDEKVRKTVDARNRSLLAKIPAEVDEDEAWAIDRWPYFQHFSVDDLKDGVLDRIEAMQGESSTYYAGGGSHFELVESAVQHAEYVVERFQERFEA